MEHMKMSDLYQEMKDCLSFFGLSFYEMDKVEVYVKQEGKDIDFVFAFDGKKISTTVRKSVGQ